ncbi:RNA polymerase sigma factor [Thermogemmatispora carboxidivorans]|uniref:RNA polymerase sigma factor n=1 Tax=Thermogemmatispora carboxidivorans TaxID=1382306 RepID=UPI00069AE9BA|nr:sigma-70 family RNA polymerase sigma factor [Thermogemmatispora carboxidivorans]
MLSLTVYQECQLATAGPAAMTPAVGPLLAAPTPGFPGEEPASGEREEQADQQQLLITRVLRGDGDAFSDIALQYSSLMLRTAFMIVGDRDAAEDIVQDALIQAWHHLADLREAGALRPWLVRIVVNQCISFKRRLARSSAFLRQALCDLETDLLARTAELHKGSIERSWDLARAVEELPTKQRVAIVLHYYSGMTLPEMARALHISENTLKKRIQSALSNLRQALMSEASDRVVTARPLPERYFTTATRRS